MDTLKIISGIAAFGVVLVSWITHFFACFATNSPILFIIGGVIPPVGIIHGIGVWFGWWS